MNETLIFDDVVSDEYGKWTQLCENHADDLKASKNNSHAIGTCGVVGCSNEADYYYTVD